MRAYLARHLQGLPLGGIEAEGGECAPAHAVRELEVAVDGDGQGVRQGQLGEVRVEVGGALDQHSRRTKVKSEAPQQAGAGRAMVANGEEDDLTIGTIDGWIHTRCCLAS